MKMHRVYGYLVGRAIPPSSLSSRYCSDVPVSGGPMQRSKFLITIYSAMLIIRNFLYITVIYLTPPLLLMLGKVGLVTIDSTCAPSMSWIN